MTISAENRTHHATLLLGGFALFIFGFHLIGNAFFSYGYFRDELYYLACAARPDWGYVDQPPLSIWILSAWTALFGKGLFAIRVVPALCLAGVVWFTGQTVLRMGGSKQAIVLTSLCLIAAPILLAFGTYYSMNAIDLLLWAVAVNLLATIAGRKDTRPSPALWVALGLIMGLGLLNKLSFLWFGAGLLMALLFSPLRKQLTSPWPYLAGGLAVIMFSPYIFWNLSHDMAHVEFMQNALRYKYSSITRASFLSDVLLTENPLSVPVWIAGLFLFFFNRTFRLYRPLGVLFITVFLILLINGTSKAEYIAAAFPILFAGGGIQLARLSMRSSLKWLPYTAASLLVLSLALAPLAKPLLSPTDYVAYTDAMGIEPGGVEGKELNELPQFYADMFGWEEMARSVSEVYQSLPEEEKINARVFANNYGEAAALEVYAEDYPVPYVMSGHNNYFLWGYGEGPLGTVLVVGGDKEDHLLSFEEVMEGGHHEANYAMPYENNLTIYICRKPRADAGDLWLAVKNYN